MIVLPAVLGCGAASPETGEVLGAWPLCEPSAAIPLDDGGLLVADNEGRPEEDGEPVRPTLWIVDGAEPAAVRRDEAAQDVEALVRLGDELWVLGSLSRNKDCEVRAKRWEIHVHRPEAFTAAGVRALPAARVLERKKREIAEIEGSVDGCRRVLFGGLPGSEPVCAAIVEAARGPEGLPCDALNVEGAVAADGRVWVGLRAPLVGGRAVLARVADGGALAFDAVHLVDLGGLGIRELATDGDRLYGIAGAVLDPGPGDRSRLFSVPVGGLASGDLPVTVHLADLPPNAESFRLGGGEVDLLLDGSTSDRGPCATPARRIRRDLDGPS
jgi:hypothetical protein